MPYVADRTRVVIAWSRYGWRVIIESQATIESDAENSHRICHRQVDIRDWSWRQRCHRSQLCGCAHDERFGLVWIQLESILHVPLLDVGGTSDENGQPAAVLSTRIARWSWVSSAYWWHRTPWDAMTSATGLQYTANFFDLHLFSSSDFQFYDSITSTNFRSYWYHSYSILIYDVKIRLHRPNI